MNSSLTHQFSHGLPNGKTFLNTHVIGRHIAADFPFIVGHQLFDVLCDPSMQFVHDPVFSFRIQLLQNIHSII